MLEMTAIKLAAAIKEKKLSVPEAVSAYIDVIEKNDKQINAFLTVSKESALKQAQEVQSLIDKGEARSILAGVPVALKDNISTKDIETTCASKILGGYKPVFNATVVEKLERAGMIVIGKLNMDEFALGSLTSDGSAAAIVAGEVPITLGSDTGGSIRQSCSFCGVTGIKPTYGAVSRFGLAACASSLDQVGPLGQDIEDCAAMLSIISGPDEKDGTCIIEKPFDFSKPGTGIKGIKIGLPRIFLNDGIDEEVKTSVLKAAKEFEAAGATIEDFEMLYKDQIIPAFCIIRAAEVSSNLARYDGLKYGYRSPNAKTLSEVYKLSRGEGFGVEVKRNVMLGSLVLSSGYYDIYFKKALQVRTLIKNAYDKLFKQFDIILSPTVPVCKPDKNIDDPMKMYMGDIFTASVNLAGLPALALPCGFSKHSLPIGFQLIGRAFSENTLVDAARVYQNRTDHHTKKVLPAQGAKS